MSVNNGVISAPIAHTDPYVVMGISAASNGYDIGYACRNTHGRINKWCKNKPMRSYKIDELTESDKKLLNYGIKSPSIRSTPDATKSDVYEYLPPRGIKDDTHQDESFRYTDFENYDQYCIPPCKTNGNQELNLIFQPGVSITTDDDTPSSLYNLSMADFSFLNNYYLALVLTWTDQWGSTNKMYKTAEGTIGNGTLEVTITRDEIPNKRNGQVYNYYMCAVDKMNPILGAISSTANWCLLPCDNVSNVSGEIKISTHFQIDMFEQMVGTNDRMDGTSKPVMIPIDRYQEDLESYHPDDYFAVPNYSPYLQIQYSVTNRFNRPITLYADDFTTDVTETFASTKRLENYHIEGMYVPNQNGTYRKVASVELMPNQPKDIVIFLDRLLLKRDSNGNSIAIGKNWFLDDFVAEFNYMGYKTGIGTPVRLKTI